jgi:hypothetical protein
MKLGIETLFQILKDGMVIMGRYMYLPENKVLEKKSIVRSP